MRKLRSMKGPWLLVSAIAIALIVTPFAVASGEGRSIFGGKRNPSGGGAYRSETKIVSSNSTYATRQSNLSSNGGGAIYGCRSRAGNKPCIRANNLTDGHAFEFVSDGKEVGTFTNENADGAPFTTNAKGVATGLNADQVDGRSADDIVKEAQALTKFAVVNADGTLGGGRGVASSARAAAEGTYTVVFSSDVSACALSVTQTQFENAGATGVQLGDDKKTVTVRTRSGGGADGTEPTAPANRPFHLTATC
jgi:hypothetical protein